MTFAAISMQNKMVYAMLSQYSAAARSEVGSRRGESSARQIEDATIRKMMK